MSRLRQLVSFVMILAVVSMFSAPLLACEAAGHRCAMMSHAPKAAAPMAKHDCCPKKEKSEAPAKQTCHKQAAVMPTECATSTDCCDMGNTAPVVGVAQAEPAKRSVLAVVSDPPPEPYLVAAGHVDRASALPRHPRPVFELKTDLRI